MTPSNMNTRRWSALAVMLCAVFLASVDFNIVTIAIPSIQRGLGTNFSEVQLIVAGYALSFAVLLITGGRLGDLYGRRRMYMIGMTGFTIASALCGFAQSPTALVASRVLQGAFAAVMVPQALSFIQVTFTAREQSRAYAMYGMTIGFGMIAGQLLGGLLVSANLFGLDWRPVFLVNLPFGAIALTLAWLLVPESRAPAGLSFSTRSSAARLRAGRPGPGLRSRAQPCCSWSSRATSAGRRTGTARPSLCCRCFGIDRSWSDWGSGSASLQCSRRSSCCWPSISKAGST